MKSDEIREKLEQAEGLEELLNWANIAEGYITHILDNIGEFDIEEPHGWLSEIVYNLISEIESRLEGL